MSALCNHCTGSAPDWVKWINPCWLACEAVLQTYAGLVDGLNAAVVPALNAVLDPAVKAALAVRNEARTVLRGLEMAGRDVAWFFEHFDFIASLVDPKNAWKFIQGWVATTFRVELAVAMVVMWTAIGVGLFTAVGGYLFWIDWLVGGILEAL